MERFDLGDANSETATRKEVYSEGGVVKIWIIIFPA